MSPLFAMGNYSMPNRNSVEETDKVFNNVSDIYHETDIITFEEPDLASQVREKADTCIMVILNGICEVLCQNDK